MQRQPNWRSTNRYVVRLMLYFHGESGVIYRVFLILDSVVTASEKMEITDK
jgi:hypothetical protein